MRKIVTILVAAATIAVAALASSGAAEARWGGGWGGGWRGGWWGPGPVIGGFVAGAVVGSALANPYGYYGPYPYGYGGAPCVWRTVWNGYRWVRACYPY
jgi:hypothetical protein